MSEEQIYQLGFAVGGFLASLGVFKVLRRWLDSRISNIVTKKSTEVHASFFSFIAENMSAVAKSLPPESVCSLDIEFRNGTRIVAPLIFKSWLEIAPGVKTMGWQNNNDRTVYFLSVENTILFRDHRHDGAESVEVISGVMKDRLTGKEYYAGERWDIPAGEWHSVDFEADEDEACLLKITVIPRLKNIDEAPLKLDRLGEITHLA